MSRLIVFPIKKERDYFQGFLADEGIASRIMPCRRTGHILFLPDLDAFLALGGHGKTQFSLQTQYFVNTLNDISEIFCIGSAGALHPSLKIRDVVIGTKTVEHDYIEGFSKNASLPSFERSIVPRRKINNKTGLSFCIHEGIIASGDEDIVSIERAEQLLEKTGAVAVAWEGAGGARAALFSRLGFAEIRGITDNARHDVPDSFSKNLQGAMQNTAQVFLDIFT